MEAYAAIDLHSNNSVLSVIDEYGALIHEHRYPNELGALIEALTAYRSGLAGVVVESTYNCYWLVDGLMDAGFKVHLAHTAAVPQYEGLEHGDDHTDARHLANLLRLKILPEGFIYPREQRALRDLLRKRGRLVRLAVQQMLSRQSLWTRHSGQRLTANAVRQLSEDELAQKFSDSNVRQAAAVSLRLWRTLHDEEAANYAIRYSEPIQRWYQRRRAKSHRLVALKAVAHKLARACFHMLREQTDFDLQRAFV